MYAIIQLNGAEDLSLRELPPTRRAVELIIGKGMHF